MTQFKQLPPGQGCSFYFEDNGHEPIFSYITMDNEQRILDIREKQRISNLANAGAYGFSRWECESIVRASDSRTRSTTDQCCPCRMTHLVERRFVIPMSGLGVLMCEVSDSAVLNGSDGGLVPFD